MKPSDWFGRSDVDCAAEYEPVPRSSVDLWQTFISTIDRVGRPNEDPFEVEGPEELVCSVLWEAYCYCRTLEPLLMAESIDFVLLGIDERKALDFWETVTAYDPSEIPEPLSTWVQVVSARNPELRGLGDLDMEDYPLPQMDEAQQCELSAYHAGCEAERLPSAQMQGLRGSKTA